MAGCNFSEKGPLLLAERGRRSAYSVVIPANPSPCLRHAAEEFTNYVAKLTGVELPVVEGKPPEDAHAVFIRSKGLKDVDVFRFRTEGRAFVIEGESDRAALFAVYDFLENQCGCEWLTAYDEIVPERTSLEVAEAFALERKPQFVNRECGWTEVYKNPDFAAKLKLDGFRLARVYGEKQGGKPPTFDSELGICHTVMTILPPEKHFKDHPEWYAEVDGVRKGEGRVQLCLTNPEVQQRAIAYVKERIRKNYPQVKCYGVSQSDTMGYCTCPNCKALDEREGSPSGTIIAFVNKIAEAVEKEYPDVLIETLAYLYSRPAPKTLKCRDNVMVTLCTDTCDLSVPLERNRHRYRNMLPFAEDLVRWQKIAKHIYIWDYALNFRWLWHAFPSLQVLKPNYQFFADKGVTHIYLEGGHHGRHSESSEFKLWLAAHLLWDPYQSEEPLRKRFLEGYFGAAAPFARTYYEEMAKLQKDETKTPQTMWGTLNSPILTDEFFERAAGWWREAMKAVKGDKARETHVEWAMNATDYTRIMRAEPERDVTSPRFAELQEAAKRIQRDVDGETWPELRIYAEDTPIDRRSKERIRRLATMDVAREKAKQAKGKVETRAKLLEFREGLNFRGVKAPGGNEPCSATVGKGKLRLRGRMDTLGFVPFGREPQKPFSGPSTVVLQTDVSPKGGRAVLRLKERTRDAKPLAFEADWTGGLAFFDTDLDFNREYEFVSLALKIPGGRNAVQDVSVEKLEGIFRTDAAHACASR